MHHSTLLPDEPLTLTGAPVLSHLSMRAPVDLEVVIPAFDEERRLPATLRATLDFLADRPWSSAVVVVDNGSTDRTGDVVRAAMGGPVPVHLIGCAVPGKGAAVRRGFLTGSSEMVGFMDADLATPVETLDRVVPLLRSGCTTVIASRDVEDSHRAVPQGFLRRMGGEVFRAAARTVLPHVADSQCGFKFFRGADVRQALGHLEVTGFSFDLELLGRMHRAGHGIVELPVVWTDAAGSTFSPVRHGVRAFRDTVRIHRLLSELPAPLVRTIDLTATSGALSDDEDLLVGASR